MINKSILVRGMEMPDSCEKCPFLDYEQGFCFASGKKGKSGWYESNLYSGSPEFKTMRNPKCPLIEVPTPHGRLIDADILLAEAKRISGPITGDGWDNSGVYALIERQPTAMEAEE